MSSSHFIDLRCYDDGTCLVTESDAAGNVPDCKRHYNGRSVSLAWRVYRDFLSKRGRINESDDGVSDWIRYPGQGAQ